LGELAGEEWELGELAGEARWRTAEEAR